MRPPKARIPLPSQVSQNGRFGDASADRLRADIEGGRFPELDLQRDALRQAGVSDDAIYQDQASGQREDRPGLAAFLKAARQGDVIVVWRLDRLGRNLRHLVNLVQDLNDRDIGIRVLAGQGASIDTTTRPAESLSSRSSRLWRN